MSKRATIKDIALEAGLSTASISQALRPRLGSNIKLPEETVKRIKEIAERLNYRPHAGARSIRARSFHNFGFFLAKEGEYTHSPDGYIAGVHDAADAKNYRITLIRLPHQAETIRHRLPSIFDEQNLDALIIGSYHEITNTIHEKLRKDNLPIVYLNDKHANNSVYVDDVAGSRIATQHLIDKGRQSICYILRKSPDNLPLESLHHSAPDRLQGFKAAMEAASLEPHTSTIFRETVVGPGSELDDEWWESVKHHDALIAYDDDLANALARFLYNKRIRVPDDIALVGYNGDYGSLSAWQELTTMRIPSYQMGRAAVEIACELVKNDNATPIPSQKFIPQLIPGKTS
ncbi:MAG: LacI family DNA-binding transcriptional regulator [Verrucomicrobiota bacterium]